MLTISVEGAVTVAVGLAAIPLFPDYPRNTRWLSTEEQLFGEWRLANEVAGIVDEDESGVWWGVRQALRDPATYLFTFMQMMLYVDLVYRATYTDTQQHNWSINHLLPAQCDEDSWIQQYRHSLVDRPSIRRRHSPRLRRCSILFGTF